MKIQEFPIPDGAPGTGVSGIPEHPGIGDHPGIGVPTGHPSHKHKIFKINFVILGQF